MKNESAEVNLSVHDRRKISVLVVDQSLGDRAILTSALQTFGLQGVSTAESCVIALERMSQRKFSHVIFSATDSSMSTVSFMLRLLELEPSVVALPASHSPSTDQVFELLQKGARGYLVKPFSSTSLEAALAMATKGEAFPETVLHAKDRNEAFSAIVAAALDKLATAMRQSERFETARRELPKLRANMHRSLEVAHLFCQGGPERFSADLADFMLKLADGPATRLGRLRSRLRKQRRTETTAPEERSEAARQSDRMR